ncbi:hypothetical protein [Evansella clarkii]|uniref:hypothetical protein n=1 Tax=Evansella clarkii TaxID=79879 RepID=UPI001115DF5A|nr:hypothetical protein [Evansella clarkii]
MKGIAVDLTRDLILFIWLMQGLRISILKEINESIESLKKEIEEGEISTEDVKKYEEIFNKLQKENNALTEKLINEREINEYSFDRLVNIFKLITKNVSKTTLSNASDQDLRNLLWKEIMEKVETEDIIRLAENGILDERKYEFTVSGLKMFKNYIMKKL